MKSFDELWEIINEEFNWVSVHKCMIALEWTWWLGDRNGLQMYGIPDITTLKKVCKEKLKEVYDAKKFQVESGGFVYGYEDGELYLEFTIETCLTSESYKGVS